MDGLDGKNRAKMNAGGKRCSRPVTTVSSHMVNHPAALQAARSERRRQTLLGASPACRARRAA